MIRRERTTAGAGEAETRACRPGQVVLDVALVLLAGLVILGSLIAFEAPRLQVYPPPPPSAWVQSYVVGGLALVAGIGIVVFRGGRRGWTSLRRLAGALAVGATYFALIGAFNAAYFGADAAALVSLAVGVALLVAGTVLLGRS